MQTAKNSNQPQRGNPKPDDRVDLVVDLVVDHTLQAFTPATLTERTFPKGTRLLSVILTMDGDLPDDQIAIGSRMRGFDGAIEIRSVAHALVAQTLIAAILAAQPTVVILRAYFISAPLERIVQVAEEASTQTKTKIIVMVRPDQVEGVFEVA